MGNHSAVKGLNSLPIDKEWELVPSKVGENPMKWIPQQPCEQETALQAPTNQHGHTEITSVEKHKVPDPIPTMNHFLQGVGSLSTKLAK